MEKTYQLRNVEGNAKPSLTKQCETSEWKSCNVVTSFKNPQKLRENKN